MIRERIICTRTDGGVDVMLQAEASLRAMTGGGGWLPDGDGAHVNPSSHIGRGKIDEHVARLVRDGMDETAALRWVRGHAFGGLTRAEARALYIEKAGDRAASAYQVIDASELPASRWFRNAWRRSRNGGVIYVDLDAARERHSEALIQTKGNTIKRLLDEQEKANLTGRMHNMLPALLDAWRGLDLRALGTEFMAARHADDLCRAIDVEALMRDPSLILEM